LYDSTLGLAFFISAGLRALIEEEKRREQLMKEQEEIQKKQLIRFLQFVENKGSLRTHFLSLSLSLTPPGMQKLNQKSSPPPS
jgi:hypothetical protein